MYKRKITVLLLTITLHNWGTNNVQDENLQLVVVWVKFIFIPNMRHISNIVPHIINHKFSGNNNFSWKCTIFWDLGHFCVAFRKQKIVYNINFLSLWNRFKINKTWSTDTRKNCGRVSLASVSVHDVIVAGTFLSLWNCTHFSLLLFGFVVTFAFDKSVIWG